MRQEPKPKNGNQNDRSAAFRPQRRASCQGFANLPANFPDSPKSDWGEWFGLFVALVARVRFCGLKAALLSPLLLSYGLPPVLRRELTLLVRHFHSSAV